MLSDEDLLALEMDLLWGADAFGRPARPHPNVAAALPGRTVRFGPEGPPDLRARIETDAGGVSREVVTLRPALERWRGWLGAGETVRIAGGPSYVFGEGAEGAGVSTRDRKVITSAGPASLLSPVRPEPWGDEEEWADLLAGRLGPWAFGLRAERVVCVCYTPVASAVAAEAGIWTVPEERGKGWAARVVAAWAGAARDQFGTLFYSTGFENLASQGVARKLGLRFVGDIWKLETA